MNTAGNIGGLCLCLCLLRGILGADFILFLDNVAEDVVENKVAVGLASENKSLGELLVRCRLVGDFTNDLDDNVLVGCLRVDIGDANLCFLELELLDALVDSLACVLEYWYVHRSCLGDTDPLTNRDGRLLGLVS